MLEWDQVNLPEPATVQAYNLQQVYESSLLLGLFVLTVVLWFLRMAVFNKLTCATYLECARLELFWSITPLFLLAMMCSISVYVLYVNDETNTAPYMDVTVVGHQWYWSYKIGIGSGSNCLEWESRLVSRSADSGIGFMDLFTVDQPLMIPVGQLIRVLVTSDDVIHSWGAPGLGIKLDAIPGRLSRGLFEVKLPCIIYGMCMELCGSLHGLMPTVIQAVPTEVFSAWEHGLSVSMEEGSL
uniref:Cytochrome c oxidase subunit 2 n=1 Tax=Mimachlamys nobilis TaxID=106276 RepID=C4NTM8_MIMNO|nr:cytochrome c oxidase subunit II [Mimachlamys nobilis]